MPYTHRGRLRHAARLDLDIHRAFCSLYSIAPIAAIPCRTPSRVAPVPILHPAARGCPLPRPHPPRPSWHGLHRATTTPAPPGGRHQYNSSPPGRPWAPTMSCFECFMPMFQVFHLLHMFVSNVLSGRFKSRSWSCTCCKATPACFIMFQVFHMFQTTYVVSGCFKSRSWCCTCCNGYIRMFQARVPSVSSVFNSCLCCKCFI